MSAERLPPRASILIVDDHAANLAALQAILEPLGHTLVGASSGEEALEVVLEFEHELALIIMDVQMSGLDGFQTATLIKSRDRSRHIPIILLTAISTQGADVHQGYAHGAVDYLLKPIEAQVLRCKVSVFVELWQHGERLKQREANLRERERQRTRAAVGGALRGAHPDVATVRAGAAAVGRAVALQLGVARLLRARRGGDRGGRLGAGPPGRADARPRRLAPGAARATAAAARAAPAARPRRRAPLAPGAHPAAARRPRHARRLDRDGDRHP